jgi:hypothetical protein
VTRRIRRFSLLIGVIGVLLTLFAYIGTTVPVLRKYAESNRRALSEITCANAACDASKFLTDWSSEGTDYLIDTQTRFLIAGPTPTAENPGRFTRLDYSDTDFIVRFRQPGSYETPNREVWRLYSRPVEVDGKKMELIIGYAQRTPLKMIDTPSSQLGTVDQKLNEEADKITDSFKSHQSPAFRVRTFLAADGFQIVDANSQQVILWGPWVPTFLGRNAQVPAEGRQLFVYDGDLYVLQTEVDGRLVASSLVWVGSLWFVVGYCVFAFLTAGLIANFVSHRFLRRYFALIGMQIPSVEQALKNGEGQSIEFKRGLSEDEARSGKAEDELLKSMAAFANTNDGAIFIGIDDIGQVKGLGLDFKQKDRLEQKIRQLVRSRIKPTPIFDVTFEDVQGLAITKISVPRGEAPAYLLGGVIYIRYGSSDVQAQPEDLNRLITEYAH